MTDNHWHEHAMGTEHAIEEAKQLERVRIAAAQLRTAGAGTAWGDDAWDQALVNYGNALLALHALRGTA